jgi:hypothetical protein
VKKLFKNEFFVKLFSGETTGTSELEEIFECSKDFINDEIKALKECGYTHQNFSELPPFSYDLESTDLKYVKKFDLTKRICKSLK